MLNDMIWFMSDITYTHLQTFQFNHSPPILFQSCSYHSNYWIQCRKSTVQEHFIHCVGYWRTKQDQKIMASLF